MEYIEIYLLEQLAAFSRCGTLSAAAEELAVSQPALTRSMKKIEDILGVSLFDRSINRIRLNENGKRAAEQAVKLLEADREMIRLVRNFDRSSKTISIGSCVPGPLMEYPGILSSLYSGMAIVSEMAEESELLTGLRSDRFQLAILAHPLSDSDLYCQPCGSEHLYISVIAAHPAALYEKKGVTFREMDGETFLMNAHIGLWDQITRRNMPHSKLILQSDTEALLEVINASTLPSFATDLTLRVLPKRVNRVNIPFTDDDATMRYYCACRKERTEFFRPWFELLTDICRTD
ncbi:MAG: LysR family transcriptional regulator [Hornefia butyriciproducens]|uniref:LysR family transcriptional regulator n=1 Tax=Hornefia butyriciproducens TaxID=2652293 RepID=UPI002A75F434|nr:LysR family transcriptional regulator [Hornefia butyriciproducens]MDY2991556.1 LysR family transcriptional regulator [Hornefia butyriciproducens]